MYTVEYRVRPVTRYIVTKHIDIESTGSTTELGSFENEVMACNAVLAFGNSETVNARPPDVLITRRPMGDCEQVRTWTPGFGWDDEPNIKA